MDLKLENVVPWGRDFDEYKDMFLLSDDDLRSKILGCGDGPSCFNAKLSNKEADITSIDPLYQFSKSEIEDRIKQTSKTISQQLKDNRDDFVWKNIKNVDELINTRLNAMSVFLDDYDKGKKEGRYLYQELPDLSFEDDSFDLVLSSHFLFLYSEHFDLNFHKKSILKMCNISRKEVRIFPIKTLKNEPSPYLEPIIKFLDHKGYKADIVKTDYEFQKGADEMLRVFV